MLDVENREQVLPLRELTLEDRFASTEAQECVAVEMEAHARCNGTQGCSNGGGDADSCSSIKVSWDHVSGSVLRLDLLGVSCIIAVYEQKP